MINLLQCSKYLLIFIESKINITLQNHSLQTLLNDLEIKENSFKINPIRGIILPLDSQLIKISINESEKITKQIFQSKKKFLRQSQIEIANLSIACSYFLQYNKQVLGKKQDLNSLSSYNDVRMKEINAKQNYTLKIFIYNDEAVKNIRPSSNTQSLTVIPQLALKSPIQSLKQIKSPQSDPFHAIQKHESAKSQQFKKKLQKINLNTLTSSNFIKDTQSQIIKFQNSKLNQQFNFAKGALTMSQLDLKKQKRLQTAFSEINLPSSQPVLGGPSHSIKVLPPSQVNIHVPVTANDISYDKDQLLQMKPPRLSLKSPKFQSEQKIQQSIVLRNYNQTHHEPTHKILSLSASSQQSEKRAFSQSFTTQKKKRKIIEKTDNNKPIQLALLAVLAAIFVSLGANIRTLFFS